MKTLYEIWWLSPKYELPLCEYISYGMFGSLFRNQVVSVNRKILEETIERLKIISPSDYSYEIREKLS